MEDKIFKTREIRFIGRKRRILLHKESGYLSIIALTNLLLLKNDINLPSDSTEISLQEIISALSMRMVLSNINTEKNDVSFEEQKRKVHWAIAFLPRLTKFREIDYTEEHVIFELLHTPLYHAWITDPQVLSCTPKLEGLKERELCVFFYNNQFRTMFKINEGLYLLVTDQVFTNQTDPVWEKLTEVNGDRLLVTDMFAEIGVDYERHDNPNLQNIVVDMRTLAWDEVEESFVNICRLELEDKICKLLPLKDLAQSPSQKLKILYKLVESRLCLEKFNLDWWRQSSGDVLVILDLLEKYENKLFLSSNLPIFERVLNYNKGPMFEGNIQVVGEMKTLIVGLSYEFFAAFKHAELGTSEYKEWLAEESTLHLLCQKVLVYAKRVHDLSLLADAACIMVYLIYYKSKEECNKLNWVPKNCGEWLRELMELCSEYGDKETVDFVKLAYCYHLVMMGELRDAMKEMESFLTKLKHFDHTNETHLYRLFAQIGLYASKTGQTELAYASLCWLEEHDDLLGQKNLHMPILESDPDPVKLSSYIPRHMHLDLDLLKNALVKSSRGSSSIGGGIEDSSPVIVAKNVIEVWNGLNCPVCGRVFGARFKMSNHLRAKHNLK